jgi:hypothetical protein
MRFRARRGSDEGNRFSLRQMGQKGGESPKLELTSHKRNLDGTRTKAATRRNSKAWGRSVGAKRRHAAPGNIGKMIQAPTGRNSQPSHRALLRGTLIASIATFCFALRRFKRCLAAHMRRRAKLHALVLFRVPPRRRPIE